MDSFSIIDKLGLLVYADSIKSLDLSLVKKALKEKSFCIIRGLVDQESLRHSMGLLGDFIEKNPDRACTGEDPTEIRSYFMKLSIGLGNHSGNSINRARFMRTIYFPLDSTDEFRLVHAFKVVAQIRNLLMGKSIDFAINGVEDGLWTAARIHHFPTGGGHMVLHRDTLLPQYLQEKDNHYQYFQPLLIMTEKGKCFNDGGGVAMIDNDLIEYEEFTQLGDIVIYDVNTTHGVNEVDLSRPFLQRSRNGRYSGLVSLYKDFSGNPS